MEYFRSGQMRRFLLILLLAGCAQISGGIDWHTWTKTQLLTGMMRTERNPGDAPVTRQTLIDNFRRIAFDLEVRALTKEQTASQELAGPHLRKWREPVGYRVVTAHEDDTAAALRKIVPFMSRLARLTGHPIRHDPTEDETASLIILYGPDAFFSAFEDEIVGRNPDGRKKDAMLRIAGFVKRWRYALSPCAGTFAESSDGEDPALPGGTLTAAIVVIKREIPANLFDSCVEEELSQVLGLMNDDLDVRPSLFNDDQEFALLTGHDEYLLKILYDDRLEPGMTPEVAMPIVRRIVEALLPES